MIYKLFSPSLLLDLHRQVGALLNNPQVPVGFVQVSPDPFDGLDSLLEVILGLHDVLLRKIQHTVHFLSLVLQQVYSEQAHNYIEVWLSTIFWNYCPSTNSRSIVYRIASLLYYYSKCISYSDERVQQNPRPQRKSHGDLRGAREKVHHGRAEDCQDGPEAAPGRDGERAQVHRPGGFEKQGKKQYQKMVDKHDEVSQKLSVLNSRIANINNEHQQLQVKFTNLQNSLELMTKQKQATFKSQIHFLEQKQLLKDRISDLAGVLRFYHDHVTLAEKVLHQNKQLKQKYAQLEVEYFSLSDRLNESKPNEEATSTKTSSKSRDENEDEQKSAQYRVLVENKQQMIVLLNQRIEELNQKHNEAEDKMSSLHHTIERQNAELKQKQEQIKRVQNEISEARKKIATLRQQNAQTSDDNKAFLKELEKKQSQFDGLRQSKTSLQNKIKLLQEQKKILASFKEENQANFEMSQKGLQLEVNKYKHQAEQRVRQIENLNRKISKLEEKIQELQENRAFWEQQQKNMQQIKQSMVQEVSKTGELTKKIADMEQNYEIRLKKLQFTANQQRIKAQALKRSLTNLEAKSQENRKQLDEMYEKKVSQDNKIAKLEKKLKEYKQFIQYLQKEKVELERTFQSKMKSLDEVVLQQIEDEPRAQNSERSENQNQQMVEQSGMIAKLQRRIVDLEEEINFLKEQNNALASKREQLQESNLELEKNFKIISHKREEAIKQIHRISNLSSSGAPIINNPSFGLDAKSREKKIAEKSLKGFEILFKLLGQLYKQYICLHVSEVHKEEIKNIEGQINTLVNKCSDMIDIFQGYL